MEVTALLIPSENDSVEEIRELARWLAGVDPNIPLYLSRFFPRYRITDRPASVKRVHNLAQEARAYLACVYIRNCLRYPRSQPHIVCHDLPLRELLRATQSTQLNGFDHEEDKSLFPHVYEGRTATFYQTLRIERIA